ncbi:histidine phosphatase superfamily [Fimicolochytrium jonesii]|uniref:histidine phosphatase superfamily n=1 Tax=Fimicolochytrium jonesii TaxID=1396493 RepID=UPI0022FE5828|nr:histidine phosphatase superfamily [Fimicolochytrium jonesii]KAI8821394.1 histidine phosphatase superfamily [Fimicolochytrium jonesii]
MPESKQRTYPAFPPPTEPTSPTCVVKRLYLCRHGQTEANSSGILQGSGINQPLNDEGERQAERLRERLAPVKCDLVVSSKLKRAQQTAEAVLKEHKNVPFEEVEELAEISWGDWEGVVNPGITQILKDWEQGDFTAKVPNGESPLEVEERAVPAIYKLVDRPEKDIIVVIHGRLLRIIMSSIFYQSLAHMSTFVHHNTCINIVDVLIETDPSKCPDISASDQRRASLARLSSRSFSENKVLDDNVTITEEETKNVCTPNGNIDHSGGLALHTGIAHPKNITFIPVLLDSIDHLA